MARGQQRIDAPVSGPPEQRPAGLSSEQAERRLAEVGANTITEAKGPSHVREFVANLVHLFALLLWGGALLAVAGGLPELSVAIVTVILVNAAFALVQEYRAEQAVAALRRMLPSRARVRRDGETVETSASRWFPATFCCSLRETASQPMQICSTRPTFGWTSRR